MEYKDVLDVAKHISDETWESLLMLLYNVTVICEKKNTDLFNRMRKILEDVMLVLKKHEYSFFATNEEKTLNNLSVHIGRDKTIPEYIQRAFHTLIRIVQDASHRLVVDYDVSCLRAPYLLRSSLYELCNILMWIGDRYNYAKND